MSTDFRAELHRLLKAADTLLGQGESPANPGQRLILTVHLEDLEDCAALARATLSQPEPVGPTPTDEELDELFTEIDQSGQALSWRAYARAVLDRWDTPTNTINQEDYDHG